MRSIGICMILALVVAVGTAGERGLNKGGEAVNLAVVDVASDVITFKPTIQFEEIRLTVSGPKGTYESSFGPGDAVFFDLVDETGSPLADGAYSWQMVVTPVVDQGLRLRLEQARKNGDDSTLREFSATHQTSGAFTIADGAAVNPDAVEQGINTRDQVILDDLIVDGSACIGMDCVNGESFGFDTLRLKENNLRIKFQDTSSSASFPTNDWQITANDSANGGANKFSIDDIDGGRTPFTIEASAPSNSLYVDDGGRLGLGTATPVVDLHVVSGNTPTLRLEQNGSSGFTPQTWDVAGNEAGFFIRDATNGSTLPFRIRPGASSSVIDIQANDEVGINTTSPGGTLHVVNTDSDPTITAENTGTFANRFMVDIINNGHGILRLDNTNPGVTVSPWQIFQQNSSGDLVFTTGGATAQVEFTDAGGVVVNGMNLTVPDFVFEPGYELMSMEDLAEFIEQEKHLPDVPSEAEIKKNGLDITGFQMKLLRKIEELTLYSLTQQNTIENLQQRLKALEHQNR